MRIGIDISQIAYAGSGVARHVSNIVLAILRQDKKNTFILFGSSLRQQNSLRTYIAEAKLINPKIQSVVLPLPQTLLSFIWNILHIIPIEKIIGKVDVFWSSDWTTPPLAGAHGVTTIHDLAVYKYPEYFDTLIINTQKKRLAWAAKEYQAFFCDSEATMHDVASILGVDKSKLFVVYSGFK